MTRAPRWVTFFLLVFMASTACSAPTTTEPPTTTETSRSGRRVTSTSSKGGTASPLPPNASEVPGQPSEPTPPVETGQPSGTPDATGTTKPDSVATTPVTSDPTASGTPTATGTTDPTGGQPATTFRVVNPAGTPAVGVPVRFYTATLNTPAAFRRRRLMATAVSELTTNDNGNIDLTLLADGTYNVEVDQSPLVRAFRFNVPVKQESLTIVLAPVGSISGVLKVPGDADSGGIWVSLLGTPYQGQTNSTGAFSILGVPSGTYHLYAERDGKFTHNVSQVPVKSGEDTQIDEATLNSATPILASLTPANGGNGTVVTITGDKFEAGKDYSVKFGNAFGTAVTRINETTLTAKSPNISDTSVSVVNVTVTIGGKDSNPMTFTPIKQLTITGAGTPFTTGDTRQYIGEATDLSGNIVASPTFTWVTTGSAATVNSSGLVTANQAGVGTLALRSGDLVSSALTLEVFNPVTASTLAGSGVVGATDGPTTAATFNEPAGIAVESGGTIYVADYRNHRIRRIAGGQVSTLAGSILNPFQLNGVGPQLNEFQNGTGASGTFNYPYHIALNGTSLLVGDTLNQRIRRVTTAGGVVTTFAGTGTIGVLQGDLTEGNALEVARFQAPSAARPGPDGQIFVADTFNHRIRRISNAGDVTTIAGSGADPGFADGAALTTAQFSEPFDIAVASDGTIYVADTSNNRIRRISNGQVTTLVGRETVGMQDGTPDVATMFSPFGLALNAAGTRLYFTELNNHAIREVNLAANPVVVRTLCGGTAGFKDGEAPLFNSPRGIAVEPSGNLVVADFNNHRIRRVNIVP